MSDSECENLNGDSIDEVSRSLACHHSNSGMQTKAYDSGSTINRWSLNNVVHNLNDHGTVSGHTDISPLSSVEATMPLSGPNTISVQV